MYKCFLIMSECGLFAVLNLKTAGEDFYIICIMSYKLGHSMQSLCHTVLLYLEFRKIQ